MYEALVARVHYYILKAEFMGLKEAESTLLLKETADAITELSKKRDAACWGCKCEKLESRWIPVTERLPFAEPGNVSERVLVTDGQDIAIAEWFNFEIEPYWSYTGIDDITHWMPRPQTPMEE